VLQDEFTSIQNSGKIHKNQVKFQLNPKGWKTLGRPRNQGEAKFYIAPGRDASEFDLLILTGLGG
jgi:hypothetical protein